MSLSERWLLPDAVEEVLPPEARKIEMLRRSMLDHMFHHGYAQVIPPMVEFTESLLTGVGHDLDIMTGKLVDQLSGRTLGISADATQQVARMDAHSIGLDTLGRYCYCVPTFNTLKPSLHAARNPIQLGAEFYGLAGVAADVELLSLAISTLNIAKLGDLVIDLGHVGIFENLMSVSGFSEEQQSTALTLLRTRAIPEFELWIREQDLNEKLTKQWLLLPSLAGDSSVLEQAKLAYSDLTGAVEAIDHLQQIETKLCNQFPSLRLQFDLCELRGLNYHTGLVFALYKAGYALELVKGGRYDDTGAVYGRSRPATGFSCDLRQLSKVTGFEEEAIERIYAPQSEQAGLQEKIAELRSAGKVVVQGYENSKDEALALSCNQQLSFENDSWLLATLN